MQFLVILPAFLAPAIFTRLLMSKATSWGLIDLPNERSSHYSPVPRGAGVGIAIGVATASIVAFLLGAIPLHALALVLGSVLLIAGIGYLDDRFGISVRARLIVQCVAVTWVLSWIMREYGVPNGMIDWFVLLIAGMGLVWSANLYNFMDGIDGLALMEAIFISIGGFYLLRSTGSPWPIILLALAVASGVVLRWNWSPARVFLGDSGSGLVGFLLAIVAIDSVATGDVKIGVWIILWGTFLIDATVTLLRRALTGQRWYAPHRSHAYQRLARRYRSHARVSIGVLLINVGWLLPWAYMVTLEVFPQILCVGAALTPLTAGVLLVGAGDRENSAQT